MMITNIKIGNDSTKYTIDTYGLFDQENELDMILYNMVEDGELKEDFTWDDYEAEYDHKGYVIELARLSHSYIADLLKDSSIVKSLAPFDETQVTSPREYNFKTDSYTLDITYDVKKLADYIAENNDEYVERFKNEWTSRDGFWSFCELYDELTSLVFYIDKIKDDDFDEYREELDQDYPGMDFIEVIAKDKLKG